MEGVPGGGLLVGEGEAEEGVFAVEAADELQGGGAAVEHPASGDEAGVAREVGVLEGGAGVGHGDVDVHVLQGLGHVALKVKDLDRSLAFYTGKLGFREMMRLHRDDGRVWLVYLRITDDQYLELFPEAAGDRAPADEANGINHFCLTVDDIGGVVSDLEKQDVPLFRPLKEGADRNRQAWILDPDGQRILVDASYSPSSTASDIDKLNSMVESLRFVPAVQE